MAPGKNGGQHAILVARKQNKRHTRAGLLKRFQEGIRGRCPQLLNVFQNEHLALGLNGRARSTGHHFANLLDQVALSAFRRDYLNVGMIAQKRFLAVNAAAAPPVCAYKRLGEGARHVQFSRAFRARKQVRMRCAIRFNHRNKQVADARLQGDLLKHRGHGYKALPS